MSANSFETAAIIGMGLMGGSLAAAFKKHEVIDKIIGYDIDPETIKKAGDLGFIDEQFLGRETDYKNLETADIIIIAVPVKKIPEILSEIKQKAASNSVVIDVGSCKSFIMNRAAEILSTPPKINFIGGHPLCGSEKSGIENYNPDMFKKQNIILTPLKNLCGNDFDQQKLVNFFKCIGMSVKIMEPDEHDKRMAYISHLPQVGASSLASVLSQKEDLAQLLQLASSGFSDTTRLAASDAEMWSDIALTNKEFILQAVEELEKILQDFRDNLENDDRERIVHFFQEARHIRKEFTVRKGD